MLGVRLFITALVYMLKEKYAKFHDLWGLL